MRIPRSCLVGLLAAAVSSPALATDVEKEVPESIGYHRPEAPINYNGIYVYGGPFYGDELRTSYVVGADYVLRFTETLSLSPGFRYAHAVFPEVPAYQDGFIKSTAIYMGSLLFMVSMPTAYQVFGKVVEGELDVHLGVGGASFNQKWGPYGFFGGGMKTFFGVPWVAFRIDIRGALNVIETPTQGSKFNAGLTITFGPQFQLGPAYD